MGLKTGLTVDKLELKNLTQKFIELEKFSKEEASKVILHTAEQTVGRMKTQVTSMGAVDTGRLRSNIEARNAGRDTVIESVAIDRETGKDYAPVVNYGLGRGRNSVARPYFSNGIRYFHDRLRKALNRALNKISK